MSAPQPLMNPGAILSGRWQIQDFIGSGETGEVYGVRDMHSTGTFALKLFWPNALKQPELWSAVQHTARTASGLGVEGVARAYDFGIDANSGRPFFVCERVSWSSLADRVRLRGPLTPAEVSSALEVLSRALDQAHAAGIVHRDLKPENVFIAPENAGWVRLSDFGVSLLRAASPPPPGWGGTAGWVSPDAADPNARSTPAMDVFALGLVTFFALSGGALHRAARSTPIDPAALWQELGTPLDSASARARELGAALDPAFDAWFQRAVAPQPGARFASVSEMASAFTAIVRTLFAPQSQNAVAVQGVAAAIAQPLIFQPESLPPATRPPDPSQRIASAAPVPTPSPAYAAAGSAPAKKRSLAPIFIGGAVACFAVTGLGAVLLYKSHTSSIQAEALASASAQAAAASASALLAQTSAPPPPTASETAAPTATTTATAAVTSVATAPVATATPVATVAKPVTTATAIAPTATAAKPVATAAKPVATATAKPTATATAKPPATAAKPTTPKKPCGSTFIPCK